MRAWFDILSIDRHAAEDEAGIRENADAVTALIDREIERGLGSRSIVLAGFSQGGALALHVALREPRRLAGVIALSSFLPLASALATEKSPANAGLPIFMAHGVADPVIGLGLADASRAHLEAEGYPVEWQTYPMAHTVSMPEIRDVARWLGERYSAAAARR
jgi:phospholipase/carboxylesterase